MKRLGFDKLIDAKVSRERALVAGRIIAPEASKLGLKRAWADTTLADDIGVTDASVPLEAAPLRIASTSARVTGWW